MKRRLLMVIITASLGAGCMNLRSVKDDPAQDIVPESFSRSSETAFTNSAWWTELGSGELNSLMRNALEKNLSISKATARMRQARATAVKRGADKIPTLTARASASTTERESPLTEGGDTRTESAEIFLSTSYEVDLWGRIASAANSASLDAEASEEDMAAMQQSIAAEVTRAYLELVYIRETRDLIEEQLQNSMDILDLIELRYRRSQANALDVLQQREQVANAESLLPPLEAGEAVMLNRLCVLTGTAPGSDLSLRKRALPELPSMPNTGIPLQLVERRPDIRAARLRLESAHQGTISAKADRLPAIRLSASAGYSSSDLSSIFDNWLARLAAEIAGPIIDGKRRRAEVERTIAVLDERISDYKATILNAISEVENALAREQAQFKYIDALEKQRASAERSFDQASLRYTKGSESYLSALRALNNLQVVQRQKLKAEFELAMFRVNLYRALAGSSNHSKEQK